MKFVGLDLAAALPGLRPLLGGDRSAERPLPERGMSLPELFQDLSVDENGAPVTFEAARWLVCFVPGLRGQFWHRFVHKTHKHVLMLKPDADGTWTLFEPWWTRLLVRTISTDQAVRFLTWAAMGDALLVEEDVPGRGNQFRGWANCVSLAVFVLGRAYCVWSPHALFKRLRSEPRTQAVDVADFVDRYFATQFERHAHGLRDLLPDTPTGLRGDLFHLGRAVFRATTAPRLIDLYRATVGTGGRFSAVAKRHYEQAQQGVRSTLAQRLGAARDRGELAVEDCQAAADRFLALLRGDLFDQVVNGQGAPPTDREIEAAVSATIDLFLGALRPATTRIRRSAPQRQDRSWKAPAGCSAHGELTIETLRAGAMTNIGPSGQHERRSDAPR
jgi:hypothetical protein